VIVRQRILQGLSVGTTLLAAAIWSVPAPAQPNSPCAVDSEDLPFHFPACALVQLHGEPHVPHKYLAGLEFNEYGLTWLQLFPGGYVYVNRNGRIVIRDVSQMDNGADWFHRGLVRLQRDAKYGFADWTGRIVVPIRYDGAGNDDQAGPSVCVGCKTVQEGEHSSFVGGTWFSVDSRGGLHEIH
jgi:hypothetical protein